MWLIKSYHTTNNKTYLKTDGYYLILRHIQLAAAGDFFIFIDYKTMEWLCVNLLKQFLKYSINHVEHQ